MPTHRTGRRSIRAEKDVLHAAPGDRGGAPRRRRLGFAAGALGALALAAAVSSPSLAQDKPQEPAAPAAAPARESALRVRTSDVHGVPVAGATVKLFDGDREVASVTTAENGGAELKSLPARALRLTATAAGRHPAEGSFDPAKVAPPRKPTASGREIPPSNGTAFASAFEVERDASDEPILRIVLQPLRRVAVSGAPKGARLAAWVVAQEFAIRQLPGASVHEVQSGSERLLARREAKADDDGGASFEDVPDGATLVVRAEADGLFVPAVAVEVEDACSAELRKAVRGMKIAGRVRDAAGRPVAGALVHTAPAVVPQALADPSRPPESQSRDAEDVALAWTVTTDQDGAFAFTSLDREKLHAVRASAGGGALASAVTWDLAAPPLDAACTADLVVLPVVALAGRLTSGGRELAASGEATLRPLPRDDGVERTAEIEGGAFRFEGLVPGRWLLAARGAGFLPMAREIDVPAEAGAPLLVEADVGAVIEGRVLDPKGAPVAGADVHAFDPAVEAGQVIRFPFGAQHEKSGKDGTFRIAGLRAGEWNLRVLVAEGQATEVVRTKAPAKDVAIRTGRCPTLRFGVTLPEGVSRRSLRLGVFRLVGDGTPYRAGEIDAEASDEKTVAYRSLPSDEDVIVRFVVPGRPPFMRSLRLLPGEDRDLGALAPPEPVALEGVVTGSDDAPVEGADVRAELSEEDVTTDGEGKFRFACVAAGSQRVSVRRFGAGNIRTGESLVDVPSAGPLRIVALRWPQVQGTVCREDGTPVRGMVLFRAVRPWGRLERPQRTEIGEDGTFSEDLEPGRWTVQVFDGSGDDAVLVREIEVAEKPDAPVLLVVRPR